jgi:uncharacterized membrane protein
MAFQILVGVWLFISPFVWGYSTMTRAAANNMIFGAVVVILGVGSYIYAYNRSHEASARSEHYEHIERKAA